MLPGSRRLAWRWTKVVLSIAFMSFILTAQQEPVRLKLIRDRTRMLKQGYPWIYRDWLKELPDAPVGSRAVVWDKDDKLLAFGMYDPTGPLAVRVCGVDGEKLNDDLIRARLEAALALRRALFDDQTSAFRLLNGEGDGLPGLTCDIYADHAVLKLDGDAPTAFWNVDAFADWLTEHLSLTRVFLKYRSDAPTRGRAIRGGVPAEPVQFLENGKRFIANLVDGQKTGFFLDQRDNRARIGALAKGRSVLNLFAYTGGFSVIEALATLAADGRHNGFFRTELLSALRILDNGDITLPKMTGSYAGAMGQPQFMPSSYLTYAVNFDGSGKRDIWTNRNDALASIANYLAKSGWRAGEPWSQPVRVPPGLTSGGRDDRRTLARWTQLGVTRADGTAFSHADSMGAVIMPDGADGEAYIVYANFAVIRLYNPSDLYALSVGLLATRVSGQASEF